MYHISLLNTLENVSKKLCILNTQKTLILYKVAIITNDPVLKKDCWELPYYDSMQSSRSGKNTSLSLNVTEVPPVKLKKTASARTEATSKEKSDTKRRQKYLLLRQMQKRVHSSWMSRSRKGKKMTMVKFEKILINYLVLMIQNTVEVVTTTNDFAPSYRETSGVQF